MAIWAVLVLTAGATTEAGKQPWVDGARLEFRLPDLRGELVTLADERFDGRVVLVDLWATWCPPCISEIPTLVDLQSRLGDRGLTIVAIAFEGQERPDVRRERLQSFTAEKGIDYLVLDGGPPEEFELALPALRNVRGFPVEILIDRTGEVALVRNSYGFKKSWARKLERDIEALLSSSAE